MPVTGADLQHALSEIAAAMTDNRDRLCRLDGEIGDADHGIAMALGWSKAAEAAAALGPELAPAAVLNAAAKAFLSAVGASSGPLYATALMRAGALARGRDALAAEDMPALIAAMADGIAHRGKASLGDKTMLDVWQPAAEAAAGKTGAEALRAAAAAAETAAEATAAMQARLGRAARLGPRSIGHVDPGAASAALLIATLAAALGAP